MNRIAMMLALVLAVFAFGCGEQGESPAPVEDGGDAGVTEGGDAADAVSFEYTHTPPEVGQWIAYQAEGEEGEFKLSIVAEEEGSFWYQIEVDGEAVAQVLVDTSLFNQLIAMSSEYMDEFITDPVAFVQEHRPASGNIMENPEHMDNMMITLRAIKKIKINDGTQLMLLDMAGVPDLVEQMLLDNPDLLDQGMAMNPDQDREMQELLAELEQAEFTMEAIEVDGLACMRFTATHPEKGTLEAVVSTELPIVPIMEARVVPNDPLKEGGAVMVTGYGYQGAVNLMTGEPDQVMPVAMMLQGMASQFQNAGGTAQ